jgi:3-oxoisoapionate kinase
MRLLSFYGDDFTGSTDVMEALASHGVDTVLFTRIPSSEEFAKFATCDAVGVAGSSRSQSPAWMDEHLPEVFQWLKKLDTRFCHYKVCSTFDSSPTVGSIGRATEIGMRKFGQKMVPLVVGAPQLKRYTFAGHLFAGYQGETYRIDRHPVMAKHPVTPMDESDLRVHLAEQTKLPTVLANEVWPEAGIGLLDVHDAATQLRAGGRLQEKSWPFVVGSSGVEYALMKAMGAGEAVFEALPKVAQTIVASGSVSPTTERQIRHALSHGFASVPVSAVALARGEGVANVIEEALKALSQGLSPLVHTALGSASNESGKLDAIIDGRRRIGERLGQVLRDILERSGLKRAIIAGGDTSSHALAQLDVFALTTRFPLTATPGSPLCSAHSNVAALDGLEIAMKGGQVGGDDYFVTLRDGLK